jgi:hypothetical protein
MSKPTRRQLEKKITELSKVMRLECRLYRGYHPASGRTGWYYIPFGEFSRFIGVNLAEAIATIDERLQG